MKQIICKCYASPATKRKLRQKGSKHLRISKAIETPEGTVKFEGELSADELDFIIGVGLTYLFKRGAIPFRVAEATSVEGTETEQ